MKSATPYIYFIKRVDNDEDIIYIYTLLSRGRLSIYIATI